MFKRATKAELKTWMLGDLFIEVLLIFFSISMIMKYTEEEKMSYLIWGLILLFTAILLVFFFYKMIIA